MNQNKKHTPLLSIIIPVYNVEHYLERCLKSILKQNFDDYEMILVNDGSTDNCPAICDYYAKKYKNIKVIHKENGGLTSARNAGLKLAKGHFIAHIDSDDYVSKDYFKEIMKVLEKYPDLDMLIFDYTTLNRKNPCLLYSIATGYCNKQIIEKKIFREYYHFILTSWRSIYKKELLMKHHCKDERISYAEDFAYTYECLYFSSNIYLLNKILYHHNNDNKNSIMNSSARYDLFKVYIYLEYISHTLLQLNHDIDKISSIHILDSIWMVIYNSMFISTNLNGKRIGTVSTKQGLLKKPWNLAKIFKKNEEIIPYYAIVKNIKYSNLKLWRDKLKKFLIGNKLYFILSFIIALEARILYKKR